MEQNFSFRLISIVSIYNLPEVWKIFADSHKRKNRTFVAQIIGHIRQTVAVGS